MSLLTTIQQAIANLINTILEDKSKITLNDFVFPPHPQMGDLSLPCFSLAKILKKSPAVLAKELSQKIKRLPIINQVQPLGPYLNFFLNREKFTQLVFEEILKEKDSYGNGHLGRHKKIMLEYVTPNTNKPLHLGHLRNAVLGWSLSQLLTAIGYQVIKTNYINDRGIHIMKSMLAYLKWHKNNKVLPKKGDHLVGHYYVLFEKMAKENPNLLAKAQELLQKWEAKDGKIRGLWKKMTTIVLQGFDKTYKKLGIRFDKTYYESKAYEKGKKLIYQWMRDKKGIVRKDASGAVVAILENQGLPNHILIKKDGTALYITSDLYLAQKKFKDYILEKSIYLVGSEQKLHFQQLFKILECQGFKQANNCYHLGYGMVYLPEGRMKSREGRVIDVDHLIAQLEKMATDPKIALAALKYYLLLPSLETDIYFEPKKSLALTGATGPYLLYSYVRIKSILEKTKNQKPKTKNQKFNFQFSISTDEWSLVMLLARFPLVIETAAQQYNPSILAKYLFELAKQFNDFYEKYPVLKAKKEEQIFRISLLYCLKIVFKKGLYLLGIKTVEKM